MYVGHLAVALASVRFRRRASLAQLLLASQGPDWIQLALGALGSDDAQLQSHSLPAVAAGALVFALFSYLRNRAWEDALLVACVYLTHPVLDLVTGFKPLWPGGRAFGADLYAHPGLDFIAEAALAVIGWMLYQRSLTSRRPAALTLLIAATLVACQAALDLGQGLRIMRKERNTVLSARQHNATPARHRVPGTGYRTGPGSGTEASAY